MSTKNLARTVFDQNARLGRRVGARGDILFWFIPTQSGGYRQALRLADEDAALWRSLPAWFRKQHGPEPAPAPLPNPDYY